MAVTKHGRTSVRGLSKIEMMRLEKLAVPGYLKDPASMSEKELAQINEADRTKEDDIQKKIDEEVERWNNLSPIQKLRELGRPLSEITLRDRSVIIGSVAGQTEYYILLDTGEGIIKLPKKDIVRRRMVK